MTYRFSQRSINNLIGVHPSLVSASHIVLDIGLMDFTIVHGLRTPEQHAEFLAKGASWTKNSKHLPQKDGYAWAIDVYPYPIDMAAVQRGDAQEISRFGFLAGLYMAVLNDMGQKSRWGGDWNMNGRTMDERRYDAMHIELML